MEELRFPFNCQTSDNCHHLEDYRGQKKMMKHAAFSRFLRRIDLIYSDKKKLLNIDMLLTSSEKISTISVPFTLESLNFSYTFNSISYILLSLKKEVIPKCKFRKVEGGPLSLWFYRVMDYCGTIKVLGNKELSHSPLISSLGLLKMDQSPNPCLWIGTSIHVISWDTSILHSSAPNTNGQPECPNCKERSFR